MESKHVMFLLAAVIGVSACVIPGTGGPQFSSTAGVNVKSFTFGTVQNIYEGDVATLLLEIQNVGSKNITKPVRYWVFGPKIDTDVSACKQKTVEDPPDTWCVNEATGPKEGFLQPSQSGFLPPIATGGEGDINQTFIELRAPEQPDGIQFQYNFFLRVCYPYSTTSVFGVSRISANEFRSTGVQTATESLKRLSAGPIQIDMPTGQNLPLVGNSLRLVFTVADVGGGFVVADQDCRDKPDVPSTDRGKIDIKVSVDGVDAETCSKTGLRLIDGRAQYSCSYTVPQDTLADPTHVFQVIADATYTYYTDRQATINVRDISII